MSTQISELVRSHDNIRSLMKFWSPPQVIDNFFNEFEMDQLKDYFCHDKNIKCFKGVGTDPNTSTFFTLETLPIFFVERLKKLLPNFRLRKSFLSSPIHLTGIHADSCRDSQSYPLKNILFTLESGGSREFLITFKIYSLFSVSVNRLDSLPQEKELYERSNYCLCSPEELIQSRNAFCRIPLRSNLMRPIYVEDITRHISDQVMGKFEVEDIIELKSNRFIIFDSCQLHCTGRLGPNLQENQNKRLIVFTEAGASG